MDPMCNQFMLTFAEGNCSPLVICHLNFFKNCMEIRMAQGAQQIKKIRAKHMRKNYNEMFYCSMTEIDYGNLNTMNWGPVFEQVPHYTTLHYTTLPS